MTGKKKDKKKLIIGIAILGGLLFTAKATMRTVRNGKGHRGDRHSLTNREEVYEQVVKPCMDHVLSFLGLIILSPLFGLISLAIYFDDPGPVFFTQKRVGKDKTFFELHKFRSMKMSTPHDVPTHQLQNPEQYITKVGAFLRKTSLDELPQIWDIFRGKMSIIGPRPALWNQEDLIAERDKYGANEVKPGLTGWAQINGRDELEIPDKAKLDGEYVEHLRQGWWKALFFDVKCFVRTILSVIGRQGVVEGGTGTLHGDGQVTVKSSDKGEDISVDSAEAGFEHYAYKKKFFINKSAENHKRVLVTGADSYIGKSFEAYAKGHYDSCFNIDTIDMIGDAWKEHDFSSYDTVFHVAGIAHADNGKVDEETKKKYYMVNTDLAIETAGKAREEGVRQFILMSSMIIYGESAPYGKQKTIDESTVPSPANFYGDSKWQADKGVRMMGDERFHVAVLRPPMIYGKGSKGNYPILARMAKKMPIFPDVNNQRSMLHINNLCEFLCQLILSGEGGIYFPQNAEYVRTADMVQEIADVAWHPMKLVKLLNPAVAIASRVPGKMGILVNKAFGNSIYAKKLSNYDGMDYQLHNLHESIILAESHDER